MLKKPSHFLTVLALLTASAFGEVRTWTNNDGKTVQAEIVSKSDDTVVLKLSDGRNGAVPISKLSKKDQDYIASWEPKLTPASISISVDVQQIGTSATTFKTSDGYINEKSWTLQRLLKVSLKANGIDNPIPAKLVVFFIGRDEETKSTQVYSSGWIPLTVSREANIYEVRSDAVKGQKTTYADDTGNTTSATGLKPKGWVVMLVQSGEIVTSAASSEVAPN